MTNIMNIFANENSNVTTSKRALAGTASMNAQAAEYKKVFMDAIDAALATDEAEAIQAQILAAAQDSNKMDELVSNYVTLDDEKVAWISEDADNEKMLASVQSKRSRLKSKDFTMEVFSSMVEAAICEQMIRLATGKAKGAVGARATGAVSYTAEELEALAADQEALRKAIRNVQSKKSIMKSKAGFDETSAYWIALCDAEAQLKALRVGTTRVVSKPDPIRDQLQELVGDQDIDKMKAADLKVLLGKVVGLAAATN